MSAEGCKIAIIGSGAAGISAARYLADNSNYDITVLEADPERYGGRIWSYEGVPGYSGLAVDFGAMWLHGGTNVNHPLTKLCLKFGIPVVHHDEGRSDMIFTYDLHGGKYTDAEFEAIESVSKYFEDIRNEMMEKKSDDVTFESAIEILTKKHPNIMNQNCVQLFGIPEMESFEGAGKKESSLIFSKGIPGCKDALNFEGEDLLIPKGYKTILEKLVTEGKKFKICLDRKVTSVSVDDNNKTVTVSGSNARNEPFTITVDHVIVTVPLGILKSDVICFNPPLSSDMENAIKNLGFGDKIKILLVFDKVFWPNIEVFGTEVELHGYPLFFINLHKIHGLKALLGTIGGSIVYEAEKENDDDIVTKTLTRLQIMFGDHSKLIFHKIVRWKDQQYIKGAYSFAKFGMKAEDAYNIRKPIGSSIFFAGEHTTFPEGVYGTVHGAYLSGIRAAKEILELQTDNILLRQQTKVIKFLPK